MKIFRGFIGAGLALLLISSAAFVEAQTINYGSRVGNTITYSNIFEYSGTSPTPLYGSPIEVGDSLIFNQMTFSCLASNGSSHITDGDIAFFINSNGSYGQWIDEIQFAEIGDLTLAGTGTPNTYDSAAINVDLTIIAVNFAPSPLGLLGDLVQTNVIFGTWTLPPPTNHDWNGSLTINLASYLASQGYAGDHVTQVSLESDNTLSAGSETNTEAFIEKKTEGLEVTAMSMIPEPSTVCLLVLGGTLLLIGRFGRKH